jgi:hypothetical protein
MNYLKMFKYYYNNEKSLKKFVFEGKDIVLSLKTKSFTKCREEESAKRFFEFLLRSDCPQPLLLYLQPGENWILGRLNGGTPWSCWLRAAV